MSLNFVFCDSNSCGIRMLDFAEFGIYERAHVSVERLSTEFNRKTFKCARADEIRRCLLAGQINVALASALVVPDVCGRIEYPCIEKDAERYAKWFNMYIFKYNGGSVGATGDKFDCFNGYMCYLLRCRVLHGEQVDVEEIPNRQGSWFMRSGYEHVYFRFSDAAFSEFYDICTVSGKRFAIYFKSIPQLILQLLNCVESFCEERNDMTLFQYPYAVEGLLMLNDES